MSEVLKRIRKFMEKEGIPGRDAHDLPTSEKAFPDGANYRIEIAGVERASTTEAMITEANRRGIVVHRAIAAVGGSTYCEFEELKAMAAMAVLCVALGIVLLLVSFAVNIFFNYLQGRTRV